MESDRMCVLYDEPELSEGYVLIRNAGAYSMSFTPNFFIEHPPSVYVYSNKEFIEVREGFARKPPVE